MNNTIKQYWHQFLNETNRDINTPCYDIFSFGADEHMANNLLSLVLNGTKTATTSILIEYTLQHKPLPQVGDLSIVTNWNNIPKCILQTQKITQLKFKEMTYDLCKHEGEDDHLESWIKGHTIFFNSIGETLGFQFNEDMIILFEDFKVIYESEA